MNREIRYTTPAKKDLAGLLSYLYAESPEASLMMLERIQTTVEKLALFPYLGREVEGDGVAMGIRRINVADTPFFLVYMAEEAGIEILRIIHGARNWPWEDLA